MEFVNDTKLWGKMFLLINCLIILFSVSLSLSLKNDELGQQQNEPISTIKTPIEQEENKHPYHSLLEVNSFRENTRPSPPAFIQLQEVVLENNNGEIPKYTNFTSTDGLMVVDMWAASACESKSREINELANRINDLLKNLRSMGVKIIHNVGESKHTKVQEQYSSIYWTEQDKGTVLSGDRSLLIRGRMYLRKRAAFLKNRKNKPDPSPLDLYPQMKPQIYCNETYNSRKKSKLVNPAIYVDQTVDIMFDSGYFYKQLAELGIKRLFYVGASLNICVFHSRQNSALMAMMSNKFEEVGIILDLTQPHIRMKAPQPGCEKMTQEQCTVEFAKWVHYRVQPKEAKKQKTMKFWQLSSAFP